MIVATCIIKVLVTWKKCEYIDFPNHPHPSRRVKTLMKPVQVHGQFKLVPKYRSIKNALIDMMKKPGFLHVSIGEIALEAVVMVYREIFMMVKFGSLHAACMWEAVPFNSREFLSGNEQRARYM